MEEYRLMENIGNEIKRKYAKIGGKTDVERRKCKVKSRKKRKKKKKKKYE